MDSYKELKVWEKSHKIALEIINISRSSQKDIFTTEIWRQCLRSSFSVPSNIVEGYHGHYGKGFISYLEVAKGSAAETDYWLLALSDIGCIKSDKYTQLSTQLKEVMLMLRGLINRLKNK